MDGHLTAGKDRPVAGGIPLPKRPLSVQWRSTNNPTDGSRERPHPRRVGMRWQSGSQLRLALWTDRAGNMGRLPGGAAGVIVRYPRRESSVRFRPVQICKRRVSCKDVVKRPMLCVQRGTCAAPSRRLSFPRTASVPNSTGRWRTSPCQTEIGSGL